MLDNFARDLAIGKRAEEIVYDTLSALDKDSKYEMVGDNPLYYHTGDIRVIDKAGNERFIEVKNDSVIHKTGNVLCEDEVYYKQHDYLKDGNMYSNYDIYAVVSEEQREIYVFDFRVLKKNYRKGEYKVIDWPQQTSYVYLLNIKEIERLGGLISVVNY